MKKAPLLVLFLTIFIDLLGFGIVIPFLPYYAREYGASGRTAGFIVGVYSLMQFFFAPVWGRLSDRVGRRPVLVVSLCGSVIGYAIFAVAHSLPMLFLSRIIAGIAAANIGTAQAYIADSTEPADRARGMGLIGAAFGLGFILGPPIGGILAVVGTRHGHPGNLYPGILAASLSLIALLVAWFRLPESKDPSIVPSTRRAPQFDPNLWRFVRGSRSMTLLFFSIFLVVLCLAGMETTVTITAREHFSFTQMDLAWLFLFMGFIVASIQGGLLGLLARRIGERQMAIIGAISLAIGFTLVPSAQGSRFLFFAAFFVAVGQGLCYPSLVSLLSQFSRREEQGSLLGFSSSVASAARIFGPVMGGALYDLWGVPGAFYTPVLFVLLAATAIVGITTAVPGNETTTSEPA